MKIELDLAVIKKNAAIRERENLAFRAYLKGKDPEKVDEIVRDLYAGVLDHVDCTACGNCCVELETSFRLQEIERLTKSLNIDKEEFINSATKPDPDGDKDIVYLNATPCRFLKDKKCTIYDLRPEECSAYPYLHKDNFISRLFGVIDNYEICPIVYNVYEQLKTVLGSRRS